MTTEKLFTASDLARFCQVDLKTIHNWADKGKNIHFRTPGRHLRFRASDVRYFLVRQGFSVPSEVIGAIADAPATPPEPSVMPAFDGPTATVGEVFDDGSVTLQVRAGDEAAVRALLGRVVRLVGQEAGA